MSEFSASQVEAIQASGYQAALVLSGGGTGAAQALLSHPGASRFVLEVQIPYSAEAMCSFLDEKRNQHCSMEAARAMAERSYERALGFSRAASPHVPILGIACTAALQTTRERRGADRAFACIKACGKTLERELEVPDGTRSEQEQAVSQELLNLIQLVVEEASV